MKLQTILGKMESVFHGKSSGLDPLVSFLNCPVIVEHGEVTPIEFALENTSDISMFLVDTGNIKEYKSFG